MQLLHTLHNKTPIYSTWGLLRECAACPTPRLNLSPELRPSWKQHLRYVPYRVRNGYNRDKSGRGVKLTSHIHLVSRLRMIRAVSLLQSNAVEACEGISLLHSLDVLS